MNNKQIEKNILQDAAQVKKNLNEFAEDETAQFSKLRDNLVQTTDKAKDDITTWVGDSVTQLNKGFDKLTTNAKETMVESAAKVKKDVRKGFNRYNAKAQEFADLVPGGLSNKVAKYPWVAISFGVVVGFLLGKLFKPARTYLE